MLSLIASVTFMFSCSPDTMHTLDPMDNPIEKDWLIQFKLLECEKPSTRSNTTWDLDGFLLYHTSGLRTMALRGSVGSLNDEYCEHGIEGGTIPSGLGDDIEGVGYASRLELNGWLIAMYHPTSVYPDNWIMYRIDDGYWERWDLSDLALVSKKE